MATQEMTARTGNSGFLDSYFSITQRGSTVRQELLAGLTTFLAMVYSIIVVPNMLGAAGFEQGSVFVATCLIAAFGSLLMGLWAKLPMAIGCAISLTAFTAFSLVLGQGLSIPVALGAIFLWVDQQTVQEGLKNRLGFFVLLCLEQIFERGYL